MPSVLEPLLLCVAGVDDAETLTALVNLAYRGGTRSWTDENGIVRGPRIDASEIRERITAPGSAMLVGSRGAQAMGCVHVEARAPVGYIGLLSVHPDVQSEGVGSRLMEAAEKHVRETLGLAQAIVWVVSARPELRAWYERLGYAATGETSPFPQDEALVPGLSFVVLGKNLASAQT